MEGKVKYVFFMIVLVLSIASIAGQGVNYKAKPGNVFGQIDIACQDLALSEEDKVGIALIPKAEWEKARQCDYETIACTDCGTGSYSVLAVGFTKGDDANKIILSDEEFSYVAGSQSSSKEIVVTYTNEES